MSRSKHFIAGILSGYGSIATNILFTMASIPLAMHYLEKEQFGLWALAVQVNGYLSLIDLGMTAAVSRFVADYKDDVNGGEYGAHLLTGGIVFGIQGMLIAAIGLGLSFYAPQLLAIRAHLATDLQHLLMLLAAMTGVSVGLRSLGSPLWAFQRNDVINHLTSLGLLTNLLLLWFGFTRGWGIFSFAIATIPVTVVTPLVYGLFCHHKGYYPSSGHWGNPCLTIFKRIFHFGKDGLLVNLGSQLINATQIMIISRWVSLEAAATFAVSTKIYAMGMLLIANPVSVSIPGLTELHVRGENSRFIQRYWDVVAMTLAGSTVVAFGLAAGNRSFVSVWTNNSIHWFWSGDLILGLLLILRNINGCFLNVFGITKNWRPVRHIYLVEGLVFVPLAVFLSIHHGMAGCLVAALVANLLCATTFLARAASKIVGSPRRIAKSCVISLGIVFSAGAIGFGGEHLSINSYIMLAAASCLTLLAGVVTWSAVLPLSIKSEIHRRLLDIGSRLRPPHIRNF